ncbi:ASPIC/UnbV domain-containing protein, partial [bacterium]|nr:ASPIC/UnbV domain-containing protein [bacterium]
GRLDLLTTSGAFGIAHNIGETGHAIVLSPVGVKNSRDGVGAIVEMLLGSRYARAACDGHPVHFGLGEAEKADALRIRWPNGIQQGVLEAAADATTPVEEKAGLVGSCPFLYTWNGRTHEFITDILTVTPLGLPIMPGMYVPPNWDEAIRVTSDQMAPTADGYLVAQVTEELREITYLDQVRLYAIDHPAGVEVQPNEKFKFPPFPEFGVHVLDGARPPVRATDHRGNDVTETLLLTDGLVVGDLPLTHYQGITGRHDLVMDFGTVPPDAPLTLHISGWFHWTNASINIAISQDPRMDFIPPQLEVLSPTGEWTPFPVEVGFPGGKTKSIPVDLTGAFPDGRAKIRIWTTLRLYWDRALLQVGESPVQPRVTMLLPDDADLHFRGHSEPIFSITGEEPERFDYDVPRSTDVPWDQHRGRYTRYGDVTPLLQEPEDMYAIMASGDECTVRWKADRLPGLPAGFTRTYFLVFDGWAKDGDFNTTLAEEVEPLPFHAMSGYPYGEGESYPADAAHEAYRAEWNTRPAKRLVRDLVAEARAAAAGSAPEAPQTQ